MTPREVRHAIEFPPGSGQYVVYRTEVISTGDDPLYLWEKLCAYIASLEKQRCQEPIEHGAVAAIREVLALKNENYGFIDDDVARVLMEREDAKAHIATLTAELSQARQVIAETADPLLAGSFREQIRSQVFKELSQDNGRARQSIKILEEDRDALRVALEARTAEKQELVETCCQLEADVKALAEALDTVSPWCMMSHGHVTCDMAKVNSARSRPTVKTLLNPVDKT